MKPDFILNKVADEVIERMKQIGVVLDRSQVFKIVSSQFSLKKFFMEKKTVKIDYIGKFIVKPEVEEVRALRKQLASLDLTGEERLAIIKSRGKKAKAKGIPPVDLLQFVNRKKGEGNVL